MKYNTKKKRIENTKRLWILASLVIGIASIGISYIGNITPSQVLAHDLVTLDVKHTETPVTAEYSLIEHICIASNGEYCEILVNLAKCESSLNKDAIGVNTNGTYDSGLYQINSVHTDISLAEKLDVYASTRWTVNKIKESEGHIWVCWKHL